MGLRPRCLRPRFFWPTISSSVFFFAHVDLGGKSTRSLWTDPCRGCSEWFLLFFVTRIFHNISRWCVHQHIGTREGRGGGQQRFVKKSALQELIDSAVIKECMLGDKVCRKARDLHVTPFIGGKQELRTRNNSCHIWTTFLRQDLFLALLFLDPLWFSSGSPKIQPSPGESRQFWSVLSRWWGFCCCAS